MRILVVEDEKDMNQIITEKLESMLSARTDTRDKVRGLDSGADDYMVKPFEFSELMARLRVLVRRQNSAKENIYRCGDLEMDINEQKVTRSGQVIALSPREFSILLFLVRNQNIVVTREQIEANVWSLQNEVTSNVVDVYIRYLRRKVDENYDSKMIQTIRGVGYMLKCE